MKKYKVLIETASLGHKSIVIEADTWDLRNGALVFGVEVATQPGQPRSMNAVITLNWDKVISIEPFREPESQEPSTGPQRANLFS